MADKPALPGPGGIRIPIMIALVLGQTIGLVRFLGNPSFLRLLGFCVISTAVNAAPLWIDWFQRRGVEPLWLALLAYGLVPKRYDWMAQHTVDNVFYIVFAAIVLIAIAFFFASVWLRASGPHSVESPYRGTLFCAFIALTTFEQSTDFLGSHDLSLLWSIPAGLPMIWYAWMYALHRIELHRLNPTGNLSILNRND